MFCILNKNFLTFYSGDSLLFSFISWKFSFFMNMSFVPSVMISVQRYQLSFYWRVCFPYQLAFLQVFFVCSRLFHIYSLLLSCIFPLGQWFHFQEIMFYYLLFLITVLSINNTVWTSFCFLGSKISFFILLYCSSLPWFSIFLIEFMSQSSYETFFSSLN